MSLKHAFTDLIADDPALPTFVRPSNWNEEHVFPGANLGEVVYVDGAGQAATDPNARWELFGTYAGALGAMNYIVGGPGPVYDATLLVGSSDFPGAAIETRQNGGSDTTSLRVGIGSDSGLLPASSGAAIRFLSATDAPVFGECVVLGPQGEPDQFIFAKDSNDEPKFVPLDDNAVDFGVADFLGRGGIGSIGPLRWRTGYFGTSVVAPLFSAGVGQDGFTGTISAADLTTQDINVVGGIIVGLV